jgi:hypothetical protein
VSEATAHELIVDAPLAHDLERLGVHVHAGDRLRLQLVQPSDPAVPGVRWDRVQSWREFGDRKRPPFQPAAGMLAHLGPAPSWEDFEEASRLAIAEAEPDPTIPE